MWLLFAAGSAFFAGVTAVLAKCGIQKTDSTVATAIRTIVVLIFAWMMVFVVGSQEQIQTIDRTTLLFLILSGLATGASWLCYFKALQIGDINKVVPIDKSSTVLTILLAFLLLREPIGLSQGIGVVLVMAWVMVLVTGKSGAVRQVPGRELAMICLSGIATGASWLCYYHALQDGPASVVAPIDKLSILVTVAFSYLVFHERLTRRSGLGLALIVAGTLAMLI